MADGYARNFLLANGLVMVAIEGNLKNVEQIQAKKDDKKQETRNKIQGIKDLMIINKSKANEEGHLWDEQGKYIARFDQFLNLHWLMKDFDHHVLYRVVNCNQIVEQLIYEKANS